ncbi:hypothetical protein N5K55_05390 [Pseudomonas aeruginosa]|nr:hypothetical protein [Pseudomonas aeruginosa]
MPDVQVLNMQGKSTFGTKLQLELEDTQGKYLLYFPCAEPDAEDDWLLDIKLFSRSFYADRVSMIFNELGLQQVSLREHLSRRESFLKKYRAGFCAQAPYPIECDCRRVGPGNDCGASGVCGVRYHHLALHVGGSDRSG